MRETMKRLKNSKPPENNEPKHLEDELLEKLCPRHKPTVEPTARKLSLRHYVIDPSRTKQSAFDLAEAKVTSAKNNKKQNYEAPPETKEKTKLEKRHTAILAVIKLKEFNPMAIPVGERGTIEDICKLEYRDLFKPETAFRTAWTSGHHLFKMENHDDSRKRGK